MLITRLRVNWSLPARTSFFSCSLAPYADNQPVTAESDVQEKVKYVYLRASSSFRGGNVY